MRFRLITFLLFLPGIITIAYAQNSEDSVLLSKYSINEKAIARGLPFYIIQIPDSVSVDLRNILNLSAKKKLSNRVYIIDNELKNRLSVIPNYYSHLAIADNNWKLTADAATALQNIRSKTTHHFFIQCKEPGLLKLLISSIPGFEKQVKNKDGLNIIAIETTPAVIHDYFLPDNNITGIDIVTSKPKEELATGGYDLSANKVNLVHARYPAINGIGEHVSIKEQYYDTTDIDLKGRLDPSPLASTVITNHANFIATIIAGAGNSVYYAQGAAWAANVSSSSFDQVLPDPDSYYQQKNISVQNHSYGTVIDNSYTISAVAFDKSANNNPELLHIFSSGNSGTSTSASGKYAGIPGYANITGGFKMAKNVLIIGAVDSLGNLAPLSSKGPAYDGRLLPHLVAFQKNGTSEAAAIVSGTTLLLQQYYKQQNNNSILPSQLAKAILINTADDINNPGPDYATGYGNMNAAKAMDLIKSNKIITGNVNQSAVQSYTIPVPANASKLIVTLAWNDTAALASSPLALTNDLDLEVTLPVNAASWKPWVLNTAPNIDSLNKPAVRGRDSLNNVEEVTIDNPQAGNYQFRVTGYNLPTGSQKFYIAYSWDTINYFKWQRLTNIDFAEANNSSILRWESNFTGTGSIESGIGSSNSWNTVASNVDLSRGYYNWVAPDTIAPAMLRMKIGNNYLYSDSFLITTLLKPSVGFICGDSLLMTWNKIKGISRYAVFQLGDKYMEPFQQVTDTSIVISKNLLKDRFLAVSPVLPNGTVAVKSYAFDYTLQGAGCYISAFFADIKDNTARLTLNIGSILRVTDIAFEKLSGSGFTTIYNQAPNNQLQFFFDYTPLVTGISIFRAKITLNNGQVIYSNQEAVQYVEPGKYLLIPVPVARNNDISLLTTLPDGEIITIIDMWGRIILQKEIRFTHEYIKTNSMPPGEYFYRISKNGNKLSSGQLLIL